MTVNTMTKYLGETPVHQRDTPFKDYGPKEWALEYIHRYGGIDGSHHKAWVLDQVTRILNGAPIDIRLARWSDGKSEFRCEVGASKAYEQFVKNACDGEDGPDSYRWDVGIAP